MRVVGLILLWMLSCSVFSAEPQPQPVVLDAQGDTLPAGALWRAGTHRFFPPWNTTSVTYSPDNLFIATSNDRGVIYLWDSSSGKQLQTYQVPLPKDDSPPEISEILFTPDGKRLIASEGKGVRIWDVNNRKEHFFISKEDASLTQLALSPDGKRLALSFNNSVFLYDTATGQVIEAVKDGVAEELDINGLAFSPDGKMLLVAQKLPEPEKKPEPATPPDKPAEDPKPPVEPEKKPESAPPIEKPVEDPKPQSVPVLGPNTPPNPAPPIPGLLDEVKPVEEPKEPTEFATLTWIDATTLKKMRTTAQLPGPINHLACSPDGKYAVTHSDFDGLRLWNLTTGEQVAQAKDANLLTVSRLKFTPDGKWLTCMTDDTAIELFNLPELKACNLLHYWGNESNFSCFAFSSDMKYVTLAGDNRTMKQFSLSTGNGWVKQRSVELGSRISALTFSPEQKTLLASCDDKSLRFVDIESAKEKRQLPNLTYEISRMQFRSDGKAIFLDDSEIKFHALDAETGAELEGFKKPAEHSILMERCHVPGQVAVLDEHGTLSLLDAQNGEVKSTLSGGTEALVIPDPKGESALVMIEHGQTAEIALWDLREKKRKNIWSVAGSTEPETVYWPAADLPMFYSADSSLLKAFDPQNGRVLWTRFTGRSASFMDLSPDRSLLAVSYDEECVELLDPKTGEVRMRLGDHGKDITRAIFTPNGKELITCDRDGHLEFWESGPTLLTHETPPPPGRLNGNATMLRWTPDGKSVITLSDNALEYQLSHQAFIEKYDAETGARKQELGMRTPQEPGVHLGRQWQDVGITPDSSTVIALERESQNVVFLSTETGLEKRHLDLPEGQFCSAISPDARQLLLCQPGEKFMVLDLNSDQRREFTLNTENQAAFPGRKLNKRARNPDGLRPTRIVFTPNGKQAIFSACDPNGRGVLHLLDLAAAKSFELTSLLESAYNEWACTADGLHVVMYNGRNGGKQELVETSTMQPVVNIPAEDQKEALTIKAAEFSPDGHWLAVGTYLGDVLLLERRSGKQRHAFTGHSGSILSVAFSPDGKRLLSSAEDGQILCWKVPEFETESQRISEKDLQEAWDHLGDGDALIGHQALLKLVQGGDEAVKLLRVHIKDLRGDTDVIQQLITDLDHDESAVREKATQELIKRGQEAEPQVRAAFEKPPSLEVKSRCRTVLDAMKSPQNVSPLGTQRLRALIVLEWIGTPLAQEALKVLSTTAIAERERTQARLAMERLEKLKK